MPNDDAALHHLFKLLFQAHPWHGVSSGETAPTEVRAFIEIVPTDPVKYELDKSSGHLRVDRPQRFSSMCPTLYGFIPQTLIFRDEAPPATVALVAMPNQPHELTAPAGPAPKPLSAPRKGAAAARVEPTPARAPTPAGRRTDNIDPWEK